MKMSETLKPVINTIKVIAPTTIMSVLLQLIELMPILQENKALKKIVGAS